MLKFVFNYTEIVLRMASNNVGLLIWLENIKHFYKIVTKARFVTQVGFKIQILRIVRDNSYFCSFSTDQLNFITTSLVIPTSGQMCTQTHPTHSSCLGFRGLGLQPPERIPRSVSSTLPDCTLVSQGAWNWAGSHQTAVAISVCTWVSLQVSHMKCLRDPC